MIELLKNELYKIYSRKLIYITLLFFTLIIAYFSLAQTSMPNNLYGSVREYYNAFKQYEGPLTPKKIAMANEWIANREKDDNYWTHDGSGRKINLNHEGYILNDIFSTIQSVNDDMKTRDRMINNLKHQLETTKDVNSYKYRNVNLNYSMLKNLTLSGIYITNRSFFGLYSVVDLLTAVGTVIMPIMLILGISSVFSGEYATNMDSIILSSKRGKGHVITAKILASAIYIASIGLYIFFLLLVLQILSLGKLGLIGWNYPVQATNSLSVSPYNFTILKYVIMHVLLYLFGGISLGGIVLLISVYSKNSIIPMVVGGGIFGFPLLLSQILGIQAEKGLTWYILHFSYEELINVRNMFSYYKSFDFFGYPVLYANVMVTLFVIITIIAIYAIYKGFRNHQVV